MESIRSKYKDEVEFVCGYEAGSMGYKLYHELTERGVKCIILAPTTMGIMKTNRIKTDKKDAGNFGGH